MQSHTLRTEIQRNGLLMLIQRCKMTVNLFPLMIKMTVNTYQWQIAFRQQRRQMWDFNVMCVPTVMAFPVQGQVDRWWWRGEGLGPNINIEQEPQRGRGALVPTAGPGSSLWLMPLQQQQMSAHLPLSLTQVLHLHAA